MVASEVSKERGAWSASQTLTLGVSNHPGEVPLNVGVDTPFRYRAFDVNVCGNLWSLYLEL